MDANMQDLMNAAQQKLNMQQKQQMAPNGDIYADIMNEMDDERIPSIKYSQEQQYGDIDIQHDAVQEDDIALENNEPIFDDGPSVAQVSLWKKQFSKEKVFHTRIINKDFIFRTLNRFEYKQIVAVENIDALYREELICQTCVLWPIAYNFQKMAEEEAGYPSTLAQIIMENSGFTKEYGIEVL